MATGYNHYIPHEIRDFIISNRDIKKYLWRHVHKHMSTAYSIYSPTDYFRMVNQVLSEIPDDPVSYPIPGENYSRLEEMWIATLEEEFKDYLNDPDGYSKLILILTVLEKIQDRGMGGNRIYLSMCGGYNGTWRKLKPKNVKTVPNFYKVIITLSESSFYMIKLADGAVKDKLPMNQRVWDRDTALKYIDYGYLDDELFDLMFRDSFRVKLKGLIDTYVRAFDIIG